jgi:hypothetical protein
MKVKTRYGVLVLLVIAILLVLAHAVSNPLIYSVENDTFSTPFHDNIDVLTSQPQNSTTDIDPLIQDFIDYPGPISLEIQINDVADAQRDLQSFSKSRIRLNNLIVKLNMNQSEIQDIEDNTAQQGQILNTLLNTSVTLDSLQSLEVQYRDEGNNDMLTTVRLQGDALRKQVQALDDRYRNSTEKITTLTTKFGLDDTKNLASQKSVDQITTEIAQPQPASQIAVNTTLTPGDLRLSLYLIPDSGKYGDSIQCMGLSLALKGNTTIRASGQPITLYLDDNPVSRVTTDMFGYYNVKIRIGKFAAGNYTVYARSPDTRSANQTLTVIMADSVTNLSVSRPDANGNVNCTGFVMAGYAVPSASVQITVDQSNVIVTKTYPNGEFIQKIPLVPGNHTLVADFYGDGYPLNPSESAPVTVDITNLHGTSIDYRQIARILLVVGIIIVSVGAAALYLWRLSQRYWERRKQVRKRMPATIRDALFPAGSGNTVDNKSAAKESPDTIKESLIACYSRILKEQGLSAASRGAYQLLAQRIARDLNIRKHKTLTAREMSRKCREKPYCTAFSRFVSVYERIRYGGQVSVNDQSHMETAIDAAEEQIGSDDH